MATCNCRLHLLAKFKKQGIGISVTDSVFKAIVLNKIFMLRQFYLFIYYMIYIAPISRIESEALASLGGEHD